MSTEVIKGKIHCSSETMLKKLAEWRFFNKKIVFTNGCFDILHRGHIEYLSQAAVLGDVLIIGLNSDSSVRKIKGNGRPVQDEQSRSFVLAAFSFVTAVVLFEEETPYELIRIIQPDILVKGGDYSPEKIIGYDIVKNKNGRIETISMIEGYSTTRIIEKLSALATNYK